MVELVINRLVAISASDIGKEARSIGFSNQIQEIRDINRAICSLNVVKGLSDTICASAAVKGF